MKKLFLCVLVCALPIAVQAARPPYQPPVPFIIVDRVPPPPPQPVPPKFRTWSELIRWLQGRL